jgi:hypothetical protein
VKQIVCEFRIGRYLYMSRLSRDGRGVEFLHEIQYRYVYDHEGD